MGEAFVRYLLSFLHKITQAITVASFIDFGLRVAKIACQRVIYWRQCSHSSDKPYLFKIKPQSADDNGANKPY